MYEKELGYVVWKIYKASHMEMLVFLIVDVTDDGILQIWDMILKQAM